MHLRISENLHLFKLAFFPKKNFFHVIFSEKYTVVKVFFVLFCFDNIIIKLLYYYDYLF